MTAEATLKLLWDCASALTPETHTKKLLKSSYINTCRKIVKNQLQMPKEKFAAAHMCPRCGCFWSECKFRLKLRPQKLASSAKARKLIATLEEAQLTQTKGLLTKTQRRRAKWLKKRLASNVEIICDYCQQKTLVPLEKSKRCNKSAQSEVEVVAETPEITLKTKTKKKKQKNKTAGLKICKVSQGADQPINPLPSSQTTLTMPPKLITNSVINAMKIKPQTMPKSAHIVSSAKVSQTLKAKKTQKKKKPSTAAASVSKIQSKTQQQNSLLQLAALLKSQTSKTATNTSQNRLETLLK